MIYPLREIQVHCHWEREHHVLPLCLSFTVSYGDPMGTVLVITANAAAETLPYSSSISNRLGIAVAAITTASVLVMRL